MILEEETFEAFGYYPRDLKPQSHKLIIAACELCGEFRVLLRHRYRSFCNSCGHKGKTHTEETKAKISAVLTGKTHTYEAKALMSAAKKGNTNALGFKHTEEAKALMSAAKKGEKCYNWKGGEKLRFQRQHNSRRKLGSSFLSPLTKDEVGHHVTDEYVIGIPKDVHQSIGGRRKKHRTRVLQWLKANNKKKYNKVLCVLAKEPFY